MNIIKCVSKYIMLIGTFSLILELLYMLRSFSIYGNIVQPIWTEIWFVISILFILLYLFIEIIVNYKIIVVEIRDFLRC